MTDKFPLTDLIDFVTGELRIAADNAASRSPGQRVMQFAECELEMVIEVEKSGEAGFKVWVVNIAGGSKKSESNTIRVRFAAISSNPIQYPQDTQGGGVNLERKEGTEWQKEDPTRQ